MYDELVKRLRGSVDWRSEEKCDGFPYGEDYPCCVDCLEKMHGQAADVIEELSMKLHGDEAAIAGMKREIERMVVADKQRWIPVTERLPLYGQDVLAVRTYGDGEKCQEVLMAHIAVWNENTGEKWWNATNITHWMPLPKPPKNAEEGG